MLTELLNPDDKINGLESSLRLRLESPSNPMMHSMVEGFAWLLRVENSVRCNVITHLQPRNALLIWLLFVQSF